MHTGQHYIACRTIPFEPIPFEPNVVRF